MTSHFVFGNAAICFRFIPKALSNIDSDDRPLLNNWSTVNNTIMFQKYLLQIHYIMRKIRLETNVCLSQCVTVTPM